MSGSSDLQKRIEEVLQDCHHDGMLTENFAEMVQRVVDAAGNADDFPIRHRMAAAKIVSAKAEAELHRAWSKFPERQSSLHHGYAVLLEEVDELWHAIKHEGIDEVRDEAIQVAAMAIRLIVEGT